MARKSWREKYETHAEPRVCTAKKDWLGIQAGQKMLISSCEEIEALIKKIPHGSQREIPEIRAELAKRHRAHVTCPLTTGIFLRILSEVALEDIANNSGDPVPFWRVIPSKSSLAKKLSCGPEWIAAKRLAEGLQP